MKSPESTAAQGTGAVDAATGAIVPPIHTSTTYARTPGYALVGPHEYSRDDNPTYLACEEVLARLEGGAGALTFASGMAAAAAVVESTLRTGDHVVASRAMYWSFRNRLTAIADRWGLALDLVDTQTPGALERAVRPGATRLVWVETPANPTWDVTDLRRAAEVAHDAGAILAVDSTAATPVHTRPLEHGADVVVHSATKYLAGHSDVLLGVVVLAHDEAGRARAAAVETHRRRYGAIAGPMETWLGLRGIRTLHLRVERAAANAAELAHRLAAHPAVDAVRYPGFGAMLAVEVRGGAAAADAVSSGVRLWLDATSLGGVESTLERRRRWALEPLTVPESLLRLSVGVEDVEDLWADLSTALSALGGDGPRSS